MDLLDAERERLRRLYFWALSEIDAEIASDFAILRTISGAASALSILSGNDPNEVRRRCVSLAGIANPHGMRAAGVEPSVSELAEAEQLNQSIIAANLARGYFTLTEIEADGRATLRALRSESRAILRQLTSAKLYSSGRTTIANLPSGDWKLEVMLHHGAWGIMAMEAGVRAIRSDWPTELRRSPDAGYTKTLLR